MKFYRRRWKLSCSDQHYSNRYDFHMKEMKATHEFASFLKGEDDTLQMNASYFCLANTMRDTDTLKRYKYVEVGHKFLLATL